MDAGCQGGRLRFALRVYVLLLAVVATKDGKSPSVTMVLVLVGITGASSFLSLVIWFSRSLATTVY